MDPLSKAIKAKHKPSMEDDNFQFSLGPPNSGFSLFLAERTKKIHFIRHAEGHHNVATSETGSNDCLTVDHKGCRPQDHPLWDAQLTNTGIQQAEKLREHLSTRPSGGRSFTAFDLVVVSPLTRACQTARHVFGRARKPGCPGFLDPGVAPEGSPERLKGNGDQVPAPRILVREECRERWGNFVCDGRRNIRDIMAEFPDFDWSEVEHDEDIFYTFERETDEHCCERGVAFLEWLNKRPEKCIAVVTHSSFLRHLFQQFGGNTHKDDQDSMQRLAGNCELRSIVMCSHGNKDGRALQKMTRCCPSSNFRVSSISKDLHKLGNISGADDVPDGF
eukprot:CAMPEP_0119304266 /NCGR_PEP_ID=MMETSP1333-20130426/5530_1 /TAXON_ID=418940 /ORGANISM="Scyphosphaera apsteinii, Strain RCC1455" /LENGTH=332 /DNA_ID=CAMNT_0007307117 /DNA_START=51 /DNA_END=1049 /DNA_ORIENTATION=-